MECDYLTQSDSCASSIFDINLLLSRFSSRPLLFRPTHLPAPFSSSHERTKPQFLRCVAMHCAGGVNARHRYSRLDRKLTMRSTDPFADEGDPLGDSADVGSTADYIHIRIQQRNGRKTLTTLQGLPKRMCPTVLGCRRRANESFQQNMIPRNS